MTPTETAWLAGILEGEGSFFELKRPKKRTLARVSMAMTDHDIVERVAEVTGVGTVKHVPRRSRPDRKPIWHWVVQRNNDAVDVMKAVRPWMGERRTERIDGVLAVAADSNVAECSNGHDVDDPTNVFMRRGWAYCRQCFGDRFHQPSAARSSQNTGT